MVPSRDTSRLVAIMRCLRDAETGCPWDIEQTFDTIVPYTIEETFEVVDAIERRDAEGLKEELGDLLLQVVYFSQLAEEIGLFSYEDVVEGITQKMIRRHPHVFGDETARSARSAKGQWERIKAEEKDAKAARTSERLKDVEGLPVDPQRMEWLRVPDVSVQSLLDGIPNTFPALLLARKVQEKAATVGFDWTMPEPIIAKLREETMEFEAAENPIQRQAELGDLLFTIVNLARRYEIEPDSALRTTIQKFRKRFAAMEDAANGRDRPLKSMSLEELEELWIEAKRTEGASEQS